VSLAGKILCPTDLKSAKSVHDKRQDSHTVPPIITLIKTGYQALY
jgi:hypothetical protein